jgi:hypothetical protein
MVLFVYDGMWHVPLLDVAVMVIMVETERRNAIERMLMTN